MPGDPAMAAVLEEAMAEGFAQAAGGAAVSNSTDANGAEHAEAGSGNGGQFVGKDGGAADGAEQDDGRKKKVRRIATDEEVERFKRDLPGRISADDVDALLSHGFTDTDGDGKTVRYGKLLLEHIDREAHSEKDRLARKRQLGIAVRVIRGAKAIPSGSTAKPNERLYFGLSGGKAYIAVADEHSEIGAMEMVSYRRDGRRDER